MKSVGITMGNINEFRASFRYIKKMTNERKLVGLEMGVRSGYNARTILNNLNIKKLYLVDPYIQYEEYTDKLPLNAEEEAKSILLTEQYKDKIQFIKQFSDKAVEYVPNDLDFVYIDGNHSYKYVKDDIRIWYPKVKIGGVLAGHDFPNYIGVRDAVLEFTSKNKMYLHTETGDWWIIKDDRIIW
jgi:DNA-dependent RNA polymerase auxiliary subunit epsilon